MPLALISCEADIRVGGGYRFVFGLDGTETMAFFGRYVEVIPYSRIVWTNDEGEDGAVTTVTFEEKGDKTLLVLHELYPSKEALDGPSPPGVRWDGRDVRATGRASRHPGRERGTVMKSSIPRSAPGPSLRGRETDGVVAALDDEPEAAIRELEAQHGAFGTPYYAAT